MGSFESLERYREIVGDWDAFCAALERPLPLCGLVNSQRTDRATQIERLRARGISTRALDWNENAFVFDNYFKVGNTIEYVAGLINIQEEAALTAVRVLDPQPGERVADVCAAPGNKSVQIALAMQNRGTVIANDRSPQRMRAIRSTVDRLGLVNISTLHHDASNLPKDCGAFDRILADVPCSCEGTSRKNPGVLRSAEAQIPKLVGTQRAILKRAIELCRDGGRIVYATCTYAPEENEGVIADVLEEVGDLVTWLPARIPGFETSPGLTQWQGRTFGPEFENAMRVYPHQNDTGGFFVAAFQKNGPSAGDTLEPRPGESFEEIDRILEHFQMSVPDVKFVQANKKGLHAMSEGHIGVPERFVSGRGLAFARVARNFPKLTTGATMAYGKFANARVVELTEPQLTEYLKRRDVDVTFDRGFHIVRHDGLDFGLGYSDGQVLQSQFPKAFKIADSVDPFKRES